jgi:DNA polymerase III epsilon subunit-like protein
MGKMSNLYLDIETTGLDCLNDEILEIAIINDGGQTLLNTLVKPTRNTNWPEAEEIHGIQPNDVVSAPSLEELQPLLIELLIDQHIVIYNANFELGFLKDELQKAASVTCCMEAFAAEYGEWSEYWGNYRWQTLATAARYVQYQWPAKSHRALQDALATRSVWQYLTVDSERVRVKAICEDRDASFAANLDLQWMEKKQRHARLAFELRMSNFWMRWLKFLMWLERRQELSSEIYTEIFTGYPYSVWAILKGYPDLPCYRCQNKIPNSLKPFSYFKNFMPWVREELNPVAYYLSESGRSIRLLFNESQPQQIMDRYLPRYYGKQGRPNNVMPKTDLLKKGVSKKQIKALKPVAEQYNSYEGDWIPLYHLPDPYLAEAKRSPSLAER